VRILIRFLVEVQLLIINIIIVIVHTAIQHFVFRLTHIITFLQTLLAESLVYVRYIRLSYLCLLLCRVAIEH
jgi:hypothetical protein